MSAVPAEAKAARLWERLYRQGEFTVKLGLEPMRAALGACGEPQRSCPCVLVAGTNGKGSVSALLAAAAQGAGLRTGLYTSPHLIHVAERVRVNGVPLDEERACALLEAVLNDFGQPESADTDRDGAAAALPERVAPVTHKLTFFELTTLAALLAFARERCEINILEVGMGGRLDATNACDPCASVITSISFDHQAYLGHTLEAIATEKAGILRPGVPAILGSRDALPTLRARARALNAPAWCLGLDFDITPHGTSWRYDGPGGPLNVSAHPWVTLPYARDNLATALAAAASLTAPSQPLAGHTLQACFDAMTRAQWPGRFWPLPAAGRAHLGAQTTVLLDAAHNPAGAQALANALATHYPSRPWVWVAAAMADKDIAGLFAPLLASPTLAAVITTPLQSPRAASPADLCARAGLPPSCAAASLSDALSRAVTLANAHDALLVVAGSIYLLGEVLSAAHIHWRDLTTYPQHPTG